MSCTFWNMRRKLKAQQAQKEKVIVDLATAQKDEKKASKPKKEKES